MFHAPERLIYPSLHRIVMDSKAYYMDCVVGACQVCDQIETAKNLKTIDDIVKQLFRKPA